VEVWQVDAGACPSSVVSDDEQARADRIRSAHGRADFLGSRAWLRVILGRYLGLEPADVRFAVEPRGKPRIVEGGDLCFSLSRSAGAALVAVTRGRWVGADIERVRHLDHDGMAKRYFAPAEVDLLRGLPEAARAEAFFDLWVRKEAVAKASGDGLARCIGLDVRDAVASDRWSVASLDVGPGFAAAVSVDGALGPVIRMVADAAQGSSSLTGAGGRSADDAIGGTIG
jgi:4'-phosphopantetheinyl transferase